MPLRRSWKDWAFAARENGKNVLKVGKALVPLGRKCLTGAGINALKVGKALIPFGKKCLTGVSRGPLLVFVTALVNFHTADQNGRTAETNARTADQTAQTAAIQAQNQRQKSDKEPKRTKLTKLTNPTSKKQHHNPGTRREPPHLDDRAVSATTANVSGWSEKAPITPAVYGASGLPLCAQALVDNVIAKTPEDGSTIEVAVRTKGGVSHHVSGFTREYNGEQFLEVVFQTDEQHSIVSAFDVLVEDGKQMRHLGMCVEPPLEEPSAQMDRSVLIRLPHGISWRGGSLREDFEF